MRSNVVADWHIARPNHKPQRFTPKGSDSGFTFTVTGGAVFVPFSTLIKNYGADKMDKVRQALLDYDSVTAKGADALPEGARFIHEDDLPAYDGPPPPAPRKK